MNVALAPVDTGQALELSSAMVTIAPAAASIALKRTIHELRNERAYAAFLFMVTTIRTVTEATNAWILVPIPLAFAYLAVDRWTTVRRNIRDVTQGHQRVLGHEPLMLQGLSLLVGSGATQQKVTLRRPTMRAIASRAIEAAPLAEALVPSDDNIVSALVAEQTLLPVLRNHARSRAALVLVALAAGISVISQPVFAVVVCPIVALLLRKAWHVTRRMRRGQRALALLNEGGTAVIAAENLVVQRGDVQAAFALKPSSLSSLTRNDVPQARVVLRKPSQ